MSWELFLKVKTICPPTWTKENTSLNQIEFYICSCTQEKTISIQNTMYVLLCSTTMYICRWSRIPRSSLNQIEFNICIFKEKHNFNPKYYVCCTTMYIFRCGRIPRWIKLNFIFAFAEKNTISIQNTMYVVLCNTTMYIFIFAFAQKNTNLF